MAVVTVAVLILSLLPFVYLSLFDYASGDDLNYGWRLAVVIRHHEGIGAFLGAIAAQVASSYQTWQGTWSSIVLFCLEPSIWGEKWYTLVPYIALFFELGGFWLFLHEVMRRQMGLPRTVTASLYALFMLLLIQYVPNIKYAVFWYNGMAHYMIPLGATFACMAWSLHFLRSAKKRYVAGMALGMAYLGGAGYPEVVLGAVWFFLLLCSTAFFPDFFKGERAFSKRPEDAFSAVGQSVHASDPVVLHAEKQDKEGTIPYQHRGEMTEVNAKAGRDGSCVRAKELCKTSSGRQILLALGIPFLLEMTGFAVSAMAPGNKVRGGSGFGFSGERVLGTLAASAVQCTKETALLFLHVRPLILFVLIAAVITYEVYDPEKSRIRPEHPILQCVGAFLIAALVRAPENYAGVDVSSGVTNSDYMVSMLMLFLCVLYLAAWRKAHTRAGKGMTDIAKIRFWAVVFSMVLCIVGFRHLVGGTADYICMNYIRSGALADYEAQMQERFRLLSTDEKDVVVPEMNDEQGPFMHMALLDDPKAFTNWATAMFYEKDSVVAVPREEFERDADTSFLK